MDEAIKALSLDMTIVGQSSTIKQRWKKHGDLMIVHRSFYRALEQFLSLVLSDVCLDPKANSNASARAVLVELR